MSSCYNEALGMIDKGFIHGFRLMSNEFRCCGINGAQRTIEFNKVFHQEPAPSRRTLKNRTANEIVNAIMCYHTKHNLQSPLRWLVTLALLLQSMIWRRPFKGLSAPITSNIIDLFSTKI